MSGIRDVKAQQSQSHRTHDINRRLSFTVRMAVRETRAGAGKFGLAILVMGLAAATAFGLQSIATGFIDHSFADTREWLAADVMALYSGLAPTPEQWNDLRGLEESTQSTLVSELPLLLSSDQVADPVTADAKVVDPSAYPYYGEIQIASGKPLRSLLDAHSLVASADLLAALGIRVGDSIRIDQIEFQVRDVLLAEPDRFVIPPLPIGRIILSRQALDRTASLRFGAVGFHRILFKVPPEADRGALCSRLEEIFPGARVLDYTSRTPESVIVIGWVIPFLNVVGLLSLALGGVVIAAAAYFRVLESAQSIAIFKCVGATTARVVDVYLFQILMLGLIGILAGFAGARVVEDLAQRIAIGYLGVPIQTSETMSAALKIGLAGLFSALAAVQIPLSNVRRVSPLRLLRLGTGERDLDSGPKWLSWGLLLFLLVLILVTAGRQQGPFLAGVVFALVATFFLTDLAITGIHRVVRLGGTRLLWVLRHGIANLYRYRRQSRVAVAVLASGVAFIWIAAVGQYRLRSSIADTIPFHTPNLLILRVDDARRIQLIKALENRDGVNVSPFVPAAFIELTRAGRLTLEDLRRGSPDSWIQRDWPASCSDAKPAGIEVFSGKWWNKGSSETQIALSEDLARVFGVKPGARMEFRAGNRQISGRVSGLIRIAPAQRAWWREIILNCEDLPNARYSAAITVVPEHLAEVSQFLRLRFPDLVLLHIDELLMRTERVGKEVLRAIALVGSAAALMAGFVLLALIRSMRVFRVQEIALLKALGARQATLLSAVAVEYFALGALGGMLGAILGVGATSLLLYSGTGTSKWIFEPGAMAIATLASAAFTSSVGALGWWPLMRSKPLELLRSR